MPQEKSWREEGADGTSEITKGEHAAQFLEYATEMYLSGRWAGAHVGEMAWHVSFWMPDAAKIATDPRSKGGNATKTALDIN